MRYLHLFSTSPGLLSNLDFTEKSSTVSAAKQGRPSGNWLVAALECSLDAVETVIETRRSLASGAA
ncbi:hypothetical protein [Thiobacillus denitrificans]|uniref:hypothetical protein n=1 Tax=Thiobacillus denitrificans TaxID=36861 RepID=UPI0012FA5808|nr:hypothetical protein [Thiobacillus denitrificans]